MSTHRYELKFAINAETKAKLLDHSRAGLEPDPFGQQGVYRVTSQYFDTPDLAAYWEKLDGVPFRKKFRLRYYGTDFEKSSAFLEIKHRWDQTIFKERIPLKPSWKTLITDPEAFRWLDQHVAACQGEQHNTQERILQAAAKHALKGTNIISYLREAWVGKYDQRLRVTFDHLCQAFPPGDPQAPLGQHGVGLLPEAQIILEVKFDRRLPVWLRDALCAIGAHGIRFSKYAKGIDALENLPLRKFAALMRTPSPAQEQEDNNGHHQTDGPSLEQDGPKL